MLASAPTINEGSAYKRGLRHTSGDDGHLVDLVGIAAAGEVVDGGVQALQDGAVSLEAAEALGNLVANVASLNARKIKVLA